MSCGGKSFLIHYSNFKDGSPVILCMIHTPIKTLELDNANWITHTMKKKREK
jgi:hypothetical protein